MRRLNVRGVLLGACVVLVGGTAAQMHLSAAPQARQGAAPAASGASAAQIARGKQLVMTGLCHDCHTPKKMGPNGPEPDMSRMLSGHPETEKIAKPFIPAAGSPWVIGGNGGLTAWSGPWGVSFTANLTPDTLTGLRSGVWSEAVFMKALRTGKHMGVARDILPPMPWQFIGLYSDDDLKAIWAYLGTIPPIKNHVPDPIPPTSGTK